jgi:hypothetical protein
MVMIRWAGIKVVRIVEFLAPEILSRRMIWLLGVHL